MKLVFNNVKHRWGQQQFFYDVAVDSNITGIFGPSGAGKTTFLHMIAGLQTPLSGEIRFNNDVFYRSTPKKEIAGHKRNMGVVFQSGYLFPHLNIKQNLLYSTTYFKSRPKFIDCESIVEILQLKNMLSKKPAQLSGGEKQRVAIGRALLSQPRLLLLDEPFSSLDHQKRKQIIQYLLKINHHFHIPMFVISHDIADILRLTRHLLIVHNRTIEASGNYLDIARSGKAHEIIRYKQFLNVFDAYFSSNSHLEELSIFTPNPERGTHLIVNSGIDKKMPAKGTKVRFCIRPDDIALSTQTLHDISIQNQLNGIVEEIVHTNHSSFVKIDCGYSLISEVTKSAVDRMKLTKGKKINVLIKSKAIETVTVF